MGAMKLSAALVFLGYVRIDTWAMGESRSNSTERGARLWLHVGPHKTASTTIQKQLEAWQTSLTSDGWTWEDPAQFGHIMNVRMTQIANVAECYLSSKSKWRDYTETICSDWLHFLDQLKGTSKKVVMSSERFDQINDTSVAQLAFDLSHISTTIVMVYRPFYDWIASWYRQLKAHGQVELAFADWLSVSQMEYYAYNYSFTTSLHSRYAAHFSDVKVHVMGPDMMTDIVCDDFNAANTCATSRKAKVMKLNVRTKSSPHECLSSLQLQTLRTISIELHRAAYGIFASSSFPAADFDAKARICFGNPL